jgi:delta 1-pyrroline-5-carboxylate dehydrogenase
VSAFQGGGAAEIDGAVQAGGAILMRCGDVMEAHADELAKLVSRENGKPVGDARQFDISFLIGSFRFFGGLIDKLPNEFYDKGTVYASVVLEPYGVVGGIIPFNWPPIHTGAKVAPALAVGNTVVLKPGEQAPLTIMRIVELLKDVLPPDVVHAVPGIGPIAGQALASHPLVRKISFTGSTKAGFASPRRRPAISRQFSSSLAARTPSSCSKMPTSTAPCATRWKAAITTRAKPAPRPRASSSGAAFTMPSSRAWRLACAS